MYAEASLCEPSLYDKKYFIQLSGKKIIFKPDFFGQRGFHLFWNSRMLDKSLVTFLKDFIPIKY